MSGEVKKLQFSEGTNVGAPTDLSLATSTNHLKTFANDAAYLADKGAAVADGDVYIDTTYGRIRYYEGGVWKNCILTYDHADPTKTWDVVLSGATTASRTLLRFLQSSNRQIDFPDATGVIVLADNTTNLDNKTLIDSTTLIKSSTGTNRKAAFDASGATNSTKTTVHFDQTTDRDIHFPDANDTLVGKATTDALTNKDFQGGTASNAKRITVPSDTLANLLLLTRKEGTILYATDTNLFYADDGANLKPVGAAGAGEINLILNPNDKNAGWSTTGSGPTAANSTSSSDLPLNTAVGIASCIKLTSDTAARAEASHYFSYPFTTPVTLGVKLKAEVWIRPGSNFIASEWTLSVYAGSTRQALSTDSSSVTYLPNGNMKFTTYFDALAATDYTLRFARPVNAGTNAAVLNINGVIVGPGIQAAGASVTPWVAFTPTIANVTTSSTTGFWRRIGDTMEIEIAYTASAQPSGVVSAAIPSGYNIDTAKIAPNGQSAHFGTAMVYPNTGNVWTFNVQFIPATNTVRFLSNNSGDYLKNTNPFTGASGDQLSCRFTVPIAEWSGSGTVNLAQNDVEYVYNTSSATTGNDTTSFGYGPVGTIGVAITAAGTRRCRFKTPIQSTDALFLEYLPNANGPWLPVVLDNGVDIGPYQVQNGVAYGMKISTVGNSTDVDVAFGTYAWNNSTYGATGIAWPTDYRWRVKKVSGGQSVGFGAATSTQSGLVSTTTQTFGGRKNAGNSKVVVTRSGAQSINTGTTTKIQFDTEGADTNNEFDNATNYRFTPTNAGYYLAVLVVEMSSIGDAKAMQIYLRMNNSAVGQFYSDMKVGNSGGIVMNITGIFSMNGTTDYLEAFCEQNSGGSTNVSGGTSATRMIITELV